MARRASKQDIEIITFDDVIDDVLNQYSLQHSNIPAEQRDDNPFGWIDIITFAESEQFLGFKLYPWQRLALKVIYMGEPGNKNLKILDNEERCCENCVWNNNHLAELSPCFHCIYMPVEKRIQELDILRNNYFMDVDALEDADLSDKFLNEVMMIEKDLPDDSDAVVGSVKEQFKKKIGKKFSEILLIWGRRSGKSRMVSIIMLYEAYRLIQMGHPQKYFGNISPNDTIYIINVATSEETAKSAVFDKVREFVLGSPYFKSKISPGSLLETSVSFLTPHDEETNRRLAEEGLPPVAGSIKLVSGHSNSATLIGKTVYVVVIDEMAALTTRENSKLSDHEIYHRLKNSTLTFRDRAKIICISNPRTKDGQLFKLYEESFYNDNILTIQLPSWIVNPTLTEEWMKAEKASYSRRGDSQMFDMEIGARFLGGAVVPFIPPEKIDEAIDRTTSRKEYGDPKIQYYAHADPATNSDDYAFVILHTEPHPVLRDERGIPLPIVVVDHVQVWKPGRDDSGKVLPVNIADVDNYIIQAHRRFRFVSLTYDHWQSEASIQKMQTLGIPAKKTAYTSDYIEVIYGELLNLFLQNRIRIYGAGPYAEEIVDQLKHLEKKYTSTSYRVLGADGHNDDIPACIAGAAHMACGGARTLSTLPAVRTRYFPILR